MIGDARVLHVDADAFFASVEQLDDPRLVGVAVLVGGVGGRGVVASASREAKRLGARSAMPMGEARRRCGPHHVVVSGRFGRYREVSTKMFAVLARHAALVQPVSVDEGFLALRPGVRAGAAARSVRREVSEEVGITVSVGGASTLVCAKMLSDWTKSTNGPGSQVVLRDRAAERAFMARQSVRALPGVGPVTAEALARLEITTIGELATADQDLLRRLLGAAASRGLAALARNEDPREVEPPAERKQLSHERTLELDVDDTTALVERAVDTARRVAVELAEKGIAARTLVVKLRDLDFTDVSRSRTLQGPTDDPDVLASAADELTRIAHDALGRRPVRLVGVAAANLAEVVQPTLDLPPPE